MIGLADWLWVQNLVLGIHLFSAVLFVGGSFFIWLVVEPASYAAVPDESARTVLMGRVARRFGRLVTPLLVVLVASGLYNASWYLPHGTGWLATTAGRLLAAKSVAVVVLIALVYVHGRYFGPRIVALARAGRTDELKAVRRLSRKVAYANLGLMVLVLALAVLLQNYP